MSRVIPFPAGAPVADESVVVRSPAIPLHAVVAASRRRHRALIAAAAHWALARGVALPADHVALWAATAEALGWLDAVDGITDPVRASAVPEFVSAVEAWCGLNHCSPPPTLTKSLWHLFGFLSDTGRLPPASDSLTEIRAALVVFSDLLLFHPRADPPPDLTAA